MESPRGKYRLWDYVLVLQYALSLVDIIIDMVLKVVVPSCFSV